MLSGRALDSQNDGIFNPLKTEPMAKIAVKMSILRVVNFMSSPGDDFMS